MLDDKITGGMVVSPPSNFFLVGFWTLILVVAANFTVVIVQLGRSYSVFFSQKWNYYELVYIYLAIHIAVNKLQIKRWCMDPDAPTI